MDLIGYINMAVGIIGIVVSILTAPSLVETLGRAKVTGGEDEFAKLGRGLRLFGSIMVLGTFVFVLTLGLGLTIRTVMIDVGSAAPGVVGSLLAAGLVAASLTISLRLVSSWHWVPGFVGTLGLALSALVAGVRGVGPELGGTVVFFILAFLVSGVGALAIDDSHSPASD